MKKNYVNPDICIMQLNQVEMLLVSGVEDKGVIYEGNGSFAEQDYFNLPFNN